MLQHLFEGAGGAPFEMGLIFRVAAPSRVSTAEGLILSWLSSTRLDGSIRLNACWGARFSATSFPGSENTSIHAGRLERRGVLIDPKKKRRTLSPPRRHPHLSLLGGARCPWIIGVRLVDADDV
jgi:hypothetical protein